MRKIILATISIAGLLGLGASVKTFPALWAPDTVDGGAMFPVKGSGFIASTPVFVCEDGFANCMASTTDGHGEFIQFRTAPDVEGFFSLKAIQAPATPGRGVGGTKILSASVTVTVLEVACDGCIVTPTDRLSGRKGY